MNAFSAAAFTDDNKRFAFTERVRNAIDSIDGSRRVPEPNAELVDFE
jgi:hypothetical protein